MPAMPRFRPDVLALALALSAASALAAPAPAPAPKAAAHPKPVVPFIEDDYARAVDEAKARKVPIFVEAWAPW